MKNIPLKYWLEQQININVYRIYIERPHELINTNLTELLLYGRAISTNNNNATSTLKNNNKNNNNKSPPLKITNQILQFNRKGLNISFDVTKIQKKKKNNAKLNDNNNNNNNNTIKYTLQIDFKKCEIDPDKCTMDSIDQHWVLRLPFYYPGNQKRCDRMYLSKEIEQKEVQFFSAVSNIKNNNNDVNNNNKNNNTIHCNKCNAILIENNAITHVKKSPSSAFTFLSQHWYCLQQQGAKRLEHLAPNGILPVHDQSIIINQASFILMKQYMKKNAVTIVNIHTDDQIYISNIKSKKQKRNQRGLDECCEKDEKQKEEEELMKGLICNKCKTIIGEVEPRPYLNANDNTYSDVMAVKLYKYHLKEFSKKYTIDSLIGHTIATSFNTNNTRKFQVKVIVENMNKKHDDDLIMNALNPNHKFLFNSDYMIDNGKYLNITLFDIDVRCSDEQTKSLNQAIKILYKLYDNNNMIGDNKTNRIQNNVNDSSSSREVILLNVDSFDLLLTRLQYVNDKLPNSLSKMKFKEQMDVAVLYW